MSSKLKFILVIVICPVFLYFIVKQIFFINNLKNNGGIRSEAKVYSRCLPSCILVYLENGQKDQTGLKINVFLPPIYNPGDLINVVYDKSDKSIIMVDDPVQTTYFPYGALSLLLIVSSFFIR